MKYTAGELVLFYNVTNCVVIGLIATHVDDTRAIGVPSFVKDACITERTLGKEPRSWDAVLFTVYHIEKIREVLKLHQAPYARCLSPLPPSLSFEKIRNSQHEVVCVTNTGPDV